MSEAPRLTSQLLRRWAQEHRRDAERLRAEAARMIDEARDRERKATLCDEDALELEQNGADKPS